MNIIILDRDGVINYDSDSYIKSPDEWHPIPGSMEAIAKLHCAGYHIIVATNQSGLARGKFDITTLNAIHQKMHTYLSQYAGVIDSIFFCPHGPDDNCDCRKPKPGLFKEIAKCMRISLKGVPAVGDKLTDIETAKAAGANPVLVKTGNGLALVEAGGVPDDVSVYENLSAVAEALLA